MVNGCCLRRWFEEFLQSTSSEEVELEELEKLLEADSKRVFSLIPALVFGRRPMRKRLKHRLTTVAAIDMSEQGFEKGGWPFLIGLGKGGSGRRL